jgi:hypothetical protein
MQISFTFLSLTGILAACLLIFIYSACLLTIITSVFKLPAAGIVLVGCCGIGIFLVPWTILFVNTSQFTVLAMLFLLVEIITISIWTSTFHKYLKCRSHSYLATSYLDKIQKAKAVTIAIPLITIIIAINILLKMYK